MKARFFKIGRSFDMSTTQLGGLWKTLEVWQKNSGAEFLIKKLKYLKLITLGSVTVGRKSKYLKGFWGHLVTSEDLNLQQKLTMLDIYLSFKANSPTKSQLDKFYNSLQREPGREYNLSKLTTRKLVKLINKYHAKRTMSIWFHPYSHQKGIPSFGFTGRLNQSHLGHDMVNFANSEPMREWMADHSSTLLDSVKGSSQFVNMISQAAGNSVHRHEYVGEIQYIQESGYKLRAIANPLLTGQWLLDPLKDLLFKMVSSIPEDCTYDQGKGIRRTQEELRAGNTCWCFDLSDATNNIPYTFVRKAFDVFIQTLDSQWTTVYQQPWLESQISLFEKFVHGKWLTPEGETVQFERGQPLGLGPSFALLALCHHMVMWECNAKPDSYRILGDDIVIYDGPLAKRYKEYMSKTLEVPMSVDKSIISNTLAEFAGKVISSKRVLSKYRWDPIRVTNVIDVLKYHGTYALAWVPEKIQEAAANVATLPRHLGGLGWTLPKSWSHLINETKYKELLNRIEEEPLMYYVSKLRRTREVELQVAGRTERLANWSVTMSPSKLEKLERHPWYNTHYTKGLPEGADAYYILSNNPSAPSASSLVRQYLKLSD